LEQPELSISIQDFNSTPLISMSGIMEAWHGSTIKLTIESILEIAGNQLVLDVTQLTLTGHDAAMALSQMLRALPTGTRVHAVAGDELSHILRQVDLGAHVSVFTNFEELGETLRTDGRLPTLQDIAESADGELPLAA